MPDWDAVIVGGGPAGLTAGLYLCRGNLRTLLIEKEIVGGYIMNVEFIENGTFEAWKNCAQPMRIVSWFYRYTPSILRVQRHLHLMLLQRLSQNGDGCRNSGSSISTTMIVAILMHYLIPCVKRGQLARSRRN